MEFVFCQSECFRSHQVTGDRHNRWATLCCPPLAKIKPVHFNPTVWVPILGVGPLLEVSPLPPSELL